MTPNVVLWYSYAQMCSQTYKYVYTCAHTKAQIPLKAAVVDKVRQSL